MKLIACSAVALLAIVGIAMAQNFNNFNNDDGFFGNDDGFFGNDDDGFFGDDDNTWAFGGVGHGAGVVSHVSSGGSWGSSWGGSWGGMGGGMGGGMIGYGKSPVSYIPLPVHAGGKSGGAGSFLPLLLLLILIPFLLNSNQGAGNVILVNQTTG